MNVKHSKMVKLLVSNKIKGLIGSIHSDRVVDVWKFNKDEIDTLQRNMFFQMLDRARTRIPYYINNIVDYSGCENNAEWRSNLRSLPILEKTTVKTFNHQFVSKKHKLGVTSHTTSGTSGTPLRLWSSIYERSFRDAILKDWYRRVTGSKSYSPIISLSNFMSPETDPEELSWSTPGGQNVFLNAYALSYKNADRFYQLLRSYPSALLYGYPSCFYELAQIIGGRLHDWKERFFFVSSCEVLRPQYRELIERNLCARVYDQYGSQEGCHLALECEAGNMHVHPIIGIVEVVDENGFVCDDGEMGRVIVTGLLNQVMPLIRYDLGDTVVAKKGDCTCGLAWPMIGAIAGRDEDLCVTPDGRKIGHLDTASTKGLDGIRMSQLVQKEYDRFVFRIVLAPGVDKSLIEYNEQKIKHQLTSRLGYKIDLTFEYIESIPRDGGRNKLRAVIVEVNSSSCDHKSVGPDE